MTLLLMLLLKSLLVFAFAGAALLCLRRASAAARHLVCLLTLVSLLALPLFSLTLPGWHLPVPAQAQVAETALPEPTPSRPSPTLPKREGEGFQASPLPAPTPRPPVSGGPLRSEERTKQGGGFLALYLIGVLFASFRPLLGLWGIQRLHRLCVDAGDTPTLHAATDCAALLRLQTPRLCRADVPVPMTWGGRRPVVLLPTSSLAWPEDRLRSVLLHEMAHIKRRDWSCHRFADLVCALYWFHPLVWLTARRLRTESELACDDLVLSSGVPAADYARHLLEVAGSLRPASPASQTAIAMAHTSRIEGRLTMILDKTRSRRTLPRRALLTSLVLSSAALVTVALIQPTAKAQTLPVPGQAPIRAATVQLVGIMDATLPDGNGWSAEGKALPVPAFRNAWGPDAKITTKPGQKALFLVFRLPKSLPHRSVVYDVAGTTLDGFTMTRLGHARGGKTNSMSETTMQSLQMDSLDGTVVYGAGFPASLTHTTIRAGHPSGTWTTAMTVHYRSPHGYPVVNIEGGRQDVFRSRQGQRTAIDLSGDRIKYTFPNETSDSYHMIRFIAVDKSGRDWELPATIVNISGDRRQAVAHQPQNLSQLQEIRVEASTFVWTEFKNVALQPVQPAQSVSALSSSPVQPQGVIPWNSETDYVDWKAAKTYRLTERIQPSISGTRPEPPVGGQLVSGPGKVANFVIMPWKPGKSNILTVQYDYTPKITDKVHPDVIDLLTKDGTIATVITQQPTKPGRVTADTVNGRTP